MTFSSIQSMGFWIVSAVVVVHFTWFWVIPRIVGWNSPGTAGRCRILNIIAAAPSISGEAGRSAARLELVRMLNHLGRADEALKHGRKILELKMTARLESDVRFRVADALETLGQNDESTWQRNRARECLAGETRDARWHFQNGRLLESQGDVAAAIESYSQAVAVAGPAKSETKAMALLGLALAEFKTGMIAESAEHASQAAETTRNPPVRMYGHRQAGAAFATQGRLEQSERHFRAASDLARQSGDRKSLAEVLAHLAEILRKRGRLAAALEAVEEARRIKDVRACHSVLYEIHRSAGRFDKALIEIEIAAGTGALGLARYENKIQAICAFGASGLLVELGRIDEAAETLDRSARGLTDEPKLALWCKAAAARIAAVKGESERAHALLAEVESGLEPFLGDRNTLHLCMSMRARACQKLGEFALARQAWQRYLAAAAAPVDQPGAYYNLGECRLGEGDRGGAIEFFQQADALGLETHESNLARRRLEELANPAGV